MRPVVRKKRFQLARAVQHSRYGIVFPRSDLRADPGGGWGVDFEELLCDASKKTA
jgi:hypothetical protein